MVWQVSLNWMDFQRCIREIANRNLVERCSRSHGYKDLGIYSSDRVMLKVSRRDSILAPVRGVSSCSSMSRDELF